MNRMKLHRMGITILIGFVLLTGIYAVKYYRIVSTKGHYDILLENCLIQIDDIEENFGKLTERIPEYNPGIYYMGTLLPYDKQNNRLYLPQNYKETKWYGELTAVIEGEVCPIYVLSDEMIEEKVRAIREGHDFILYVQINDEEYYKVLLTITGMPLISLNTEYEKEAEEIPYEVDPDKSIFGSETRYYGDFLMIDSGVRSGQYQITEAALCYHYKGASTLGFEKKSYSIDLLDYRGEKINVSLAGMRSDSTWKLNALCTDKNLIREITASQIWELFDEANVDINEAGPNMEYVELIVDNEYRGVYCLVEPIDAKKMELQEDDVLYKVIDWQVPGAEDILESVNMGWKVQYPVRIRYPKEIRDYRKVWYPIDDYLNLFHRGNEIEFDEAMKHINLDNYCDMFLFTMVVCGSDNAYKNTYYVAESNNGIENYQMKQIPWDLDYTFGNEYCYECERNVAFKKDSYDKIYAEDALIRLFGSNPEAIGDRLKEKWEEYRHSFLATEYVINLMEENREYLLETGAFKREKERWPQSGADMDIEYLKDFQDTRMRWLDDYFEAWLKY